MPSLSMSAITTSTPDLSVDAADSSRYWFEARRPFAALLFLLPLLAIYEFGVLSLGVESVIARNGADCWMRGWLMQVGMTHHWVLPLLVVGVLITWHVQTGDRWRCSFETLKGMFGESLLFAILLVTFGQLLNLGFRHYGLETASIPGDAQRQSSVVASRAISFIGAGVYEEVLFRLAAIPACFYLLRAILVPRSLAVATSVVGTSLLFALAHYLGGTVDGFAPSQIVNTAWHIADTPALWYSFAFRLLAGLCFSMLFVLRGFGITVGSHALYDLLVGVVMQSALS
ncbi:MAG: CPBP family intramembrane glutamic endopeptidase [Planctomycetaceae bacterium]